MTEEMNSAVGQAGEELNELMQARRDKLAAIIACLYFSLNYIKLFLRFNHQLFKPFSVICEVF